MNLTPAILKGAYEYLKGTPPFNRWGLPPGDEISWHVSGRKTFYGSCATVGHRPNFRITISAELCKSTAKLMETMAHEMCHVRCDLLGVKSAHGSAFKRCAAMVCKQHGWLNETF